ncbi:DUF721 domain-containing protein [Nocardioides jishulii]|uniref:DUF721 domain-containing protein n=1 Tax=Nocardioides jishulii TaxID=2575440 RepID=A0A4U2YTS6_9ACTN|nr:DciA family protein [Nocardioides jishulii]QCX26109.1 DUF721 domain-containing protein [Nocardioides jishulii]TKI64092.1 DUF721 domain-containing protein [Nocardioides jishulii]
MSSEQPAQQAGDEPLEGTPSPAAPLPDSPTAGATGADGTDGPAPAEDLPSADGLDLARSAARAASRAPGAPAKKQRRGGDGTFTRRRGRSRFSGAHPDDRDPQPLGSTLDRLVANRGWDTDLKVQGVFGQWPSLVGREVADHCTPETLTDGKLVVRTDSTAWATQLRLLAPSIVRRLNQELGHGTVLLIEVLGPHGPSWKKGPRSAGGRGPRDTYG